MDCVIGVMDQINRSKTESIISHPFLHISPVYSRRQISSSTRCEKPFEHPPCSFRHQNPQNSYYFYTTDWQTSALSIMIIILSRMTTFTMACGREKNKWINKSTNTPPSLTLFLTNAVGYAWPYSIIAKLPFFFFFSNFRVTSHCPGMNFLWRRP